MANNSDIIVYINVGGGINWIDIREITHPYQKGSKRF